MKINIAYAPDDNYTNQTIVSMVSAIENNKLHDLEFIVIYSVLTEKNMQKFKALASENVKIRFLKIEEKRFEKLPLSKWVTVQAWFRIALPELCKDLSKILYLDCDTLIRGDLGELFEVDLEGKFFAGVKDVWGVSKYVARLGMQSKVYCNSGMLLLNSDFCNKEDFFGKIVDFANNNAKIIEFCDQDSINKVADLQKVVLHPKFNFMDTWWRGGYYEHDGVEEKEYLEAKENPVIVHLTGLKPAFKGCGNKFKGEWWQYANKTFIYDELRSDYENSKLPKTPLKDKIFSIKNEYSGKFKTKILTMCGLKLPISKPRTYEDIERRRRKNEHLKLSGKKFDMQNYLVETNKNNGIDLITIAFNNPKVIDYQIRLIKKFVSGEFSIIICDNSNLKEKSLEIRKVCEKHNVSYIHIKSKQTPRGYSDSHGIALNWVYENVVKKRKNDFAFLDHDIFPVRKIEIDKYLMEQDFYGMPCRPHKTNRINQGLWYLWPGFAFYRFDVISNKKMNFRKWRRFGLLNIKVVGADTGSANWPVLYSKYNVSDIKFCDAKFWHVRENRSLGVNEDYKSIAQTDLIQYYDDENWLHMIDGAEWQDSRGKVELVYGILDKYLN